MAAVTVTDVHRDVGELYDGISGTTTTIISGLISKANSTIIDIAGTTAGYERAIRNLAGYFVCQNILGGRDYVSIGVGGVSLGEKRIVEQRDSFYRDAESALRVKGKVLDGVAVRWTAVNQ